jgi:excisionase family DNA binding protein
MPQASSIEAPDSMTNRIQMQQEPNLNQQPDESLEMPDQLMTVSEIAAFLNVPVSWVYERTRRRGAERLPHIRLGKYLRFSLPDVLAWLRKYWGVV